MIDDLELPAPSVRLAGFAVMLKSGGETVTARVTVCERLPLVPFTEKM